MGTNRFLPGTQSSRERESNDQYVIKPEQHGEQRERARRASAAAARWASALAAASAASASAAQRSAGGPAWVP